MLRRHEQGLRDKQATFFTAALRMRFSQQGLSADFLSSSVIAMAGAACKLKPEKLWERRDSGQRQAAGLREHSGGHEGKDVDRTWMDRHRHAGSDDLHRMHVGLRDGSAGARRGRSLHPRG